MSSMYRPLFQISRPSGGLHVFSASQSVGLSVLSSRPNLLTPNSSAQSANVTTWHNDNNRTGWQQNETILRATGTGAMNQNNFGLLWQWPVTGYVYAQPLAVTYPQTIGSCNNPMQPSLHCHGAGHVVRIQRGLQFVYAVLGPG